MNSSDLKEIFVNPACNYRALARRAITQIEILEKNVKMNEDKDQRPQNEHIKKAKELIELILSAYTVATSETRPLLRHVLAELEQIKLVEPKEKLPFAFGDYAIYLMRQPFLEICDSKSKIVIYCPDEKAMNGMENQLKQFYQLNEKIDRLEVDLKDLQSQKPPCSHTCYHHQTHPCERCGRINGYLPAIWAKYQQAERIEQLEKELSKRVTDFT